MDEEMLAEALERDEREARQRCSETPGDDWEAEERLRSWR